MYTAVRYGDNVNCLQLVLSLWLYAFALVLLFLPIFGVFAFSFVPLCAGWLAGVVWIRARFESQHKY